jgi:hypothetical protein
MRDPLRWLQATRAFASAGLVRPVRPDRLLAMGLAVASGASPCDRMGDRVAPMRWRLSWSGTRPRKTCEATSVSSATKLMRRRTAGRRRGRRGGLELFLGLPGGIGGITARIT